MRKIIFLTLAFSSLVTLPVMAELGKVWTDFQYYSTDFQNYLRYNLSETLKPLESNTQNAFNNATGDLNVPNSVAAGKQVSDNIILYSISDKFDNNAALRGTSISREINRLLTRSSVESIMGKKGQTRLKAKLEDTDKTLENIVELAKVDDNTNNFLIKIFNAGAGVPPGNLDGLLGASQSQAKLQLQSIRIQSEQSKIIAETLGQTVYTNQSLQYSNLNLANISQQVEESNRARRVDTSAEAARLLRTTSQIDLFGRKVEN
jgi:hypothetical protein